MQVRFREVGPFEARLVTEDNLESFESWCTGGGVKDTRLPRAQRVVRFWRDGLEREAAVGDWIVRRSGKFYEYTQGEFDEMFEGEGS